MSSQDYAEMIEIPVNSCQILSDKPSDAREQERFLKANGILSFFKRLSKRIKSKGKNRKLLKDRVSLFTKNDGADETVLRIDGTDKNDTDENLLRDGTDKTGADKNLLRDGADKKLSGEKADKNIFSDDERTKIFKLKADKAQKRSKLKFDAVSFQVAVILLLVIGIFLTNVFWKDSGINNLFKSVFASEESEAVDDKTYDAYEAFAPTKNQIVIENGVMEITTKGALYSPADGVVESIKSDEKYTIVISHGKNYKTVITGADYSYVNKGDKVFTSTPVCYLKEGSAEVSMYDGDSLIKNYVVEDGKIVWQK